MLNLASSLVNKWVGVQMVVDMPYGMVVITSNFEAADFIRNHCRECWMSNEMRPCNGAQVIKCNETVDEVIQAWSQKGDDKCVS